jgi:1-carboxybiuret hydrolase
MAVALNIAAEVRSGRLSAAEVVRGTLRKIGEEAARYNCFSATYDEQAVATAEAIDRAVAQEVDPGPLAGVPFAVKNLFDVKGHTTLAGSPSRQSAPPAEKNAFAISRLLASGAVLVGSLHMDELACGATGENPHFGPVRNPHSRSQISGGSSSGSAAAVAARLVPISLGSDTNGSIRAPAALCGIWGVKPTFGRLSRRGCHPYAPSLDCIGGFAGSVRDLTLLYDALQGRDSDDPYQRQAEPERVAHVLDRGVAGLRVGILGGHFHEYSDNAAWSAVESCGRSLTGAKPLEISGIEAARAAASLISTIELGHLHRPTLEEKVRHLSPYVRGRIIAGALAPADWYLRAQRFRNKFVREVVALFEKFDVLLAPATPCAATPIGATQMTIGGKSLDPRSHMGVMTQPISFAGLPVVVAPCSGGGGLPTGVQIVAAPWREDLCFRVAYYLERAGTSGCATPPDSPFTSTARK